MVKDFRQNWLYFDKKASVRKLFTTAEIQFNSLSYTDRELLQTTGSNFSLGL